MESKPAHGPSTYVYLCMQISRRRSKVTCPLCIMPCVPSSELSFCFTRDLTVCGSTYFTLKTMENFVGKWKLVKTEGFDEYMKALGMIFKVYIIL